MAGACAPRRLCANGGAGHISLSEEEEPGQLLAAGRRGLTAALHRAAEAGDAEEIERLAAAGADLDARDSGGWAPIHAAVTEGHVEAVRALLAAGACMEARADEGTPLLMAAVYGQLEAARELVRAGADVEAQTRSGLRAIHVAALDGQGDLLRLLAGAGADLEACTSDGEGATAVLLAARSGQVTSVCALAACGADLDAALPNGYTAMHLAAEAGHLGVVRALQGAYGGFRVFQPAEDGITPLLLAAQAGRVEVVAELARLIKELSPGRWQYYMDARQQSTGCSALHAAAAAGSVGAVRELLRADAGVDARAAACYWGRTPLHLAAVRGQDGVIPALLAAGADIEARDKLQHSPLSLAAAFNHPRVVAALAAAGADLEARTDGDRTPLMVAVEENSAEALKALLEAGASMQVGEVTQGTALNDAAFLGHTAALKVLLAAGAGLESRTPQLGRTPLQTAAEKGHVKAVEALLRAGADVEAQDSWGFRALHLAASFGWVSAARSLVLAGGADKEAEATHGRTALLCAAAAGHWEVVWALHALQADVNARNSLGRGCLHILMEAEAAQPSPQSPHLLRRLLDAGVGNVAAAGAAAAMTYPTPLDLLTSPPEHGVPTEFGDHAHELVRLLAEAGWPVDRDLPVHGGPPTATSPSTLAGWLSGLHQRALQPGAYPHALTGSALALTRALLQAAAQQGSQGQPGLLQDAVGSGSVELVQAVAAAFPQSPSQWTRVNWPSPVLAAGARLSTLLEELAPPPPGPWEGRCGTLVLHFCQLAEALLAAGCPPAALQVVAHQPSHLTPGPTAFLVVPAWALEPLRLVLPLVAGGVVWAPERHAAFPPALRRAAQALFLACTCRGVAAPPTGPAWLRRLRGRGGRPCGRGLRQQGAPAPRRICLPSELVLAILGLAAQPLAAWVPELCPLAVPPAPAEGGPLFVYA